MIRRSDDIPRAREIRLSRKSAQSASGTFAARHFAKTDMQRKPLPGTQPTCTMGTDKGILNLLDQSPPAGSARWTRFPARSVT